jgi:hypothetical protein
LKKRIPFEESIVYTPAKKEEIINLIEPVINIP